MNNLKWDYSLYLVTDRSYIGDRKLTTCVEEAVLGGVTMVQLREKKAPSREFYVLARQLKELLAGYQIPLIINDRLDIALAVDADGLHLGQEDLPISIARTYFGFPKIIGVSVSNVREALQAEREGANYLGAGAMFTTATKIDAKLVACEELRIIKEAVSIPVVAIGGINTENASVILQTGVDGIAVVSAILKRKDIRRSARQLRNLKI